MSSMSFTILTVTSDKEARKNATHWKKTGDGRYMPACLNACPRALVTVTVNVILIGNWLCFSYQLLLSEEYDRSVNFQI